MKDDSKYVSSNDDDKLQDSFLKIVENENKYNDCSVNCLSLKKTKMKNEEIEKMEILVKDEYNLLVENKCLVIYLVMLGNMKHPKIYIGMLKKIV